MNQQQEENHEGQQREPSEGHSIKLKETEKVARQLFNQATFGLSREGKEPRDRRQQVSANINSDNNCK